MTRRGCFKALAAIAAAPVAWKLGREQAKEDRITGQTPFTNTSPAYVLASGTVSTVADFDPYTATLYLTTNGSWELYCPTLTGGKDA